MDVGKTHNPRKVVVMSLSLNTAIRATVSVKWLPPDVTWSLVLVNTSGRTVINRVWTFVIHCRCHRQANATTQTAERAMRRMQIVIIKKKEKIKRPSAASTFCVIASILSLSDAAIVLWLEHGGCSEHRVLRWIVCGQIDQIGRYRDALFCCNPSGPDCFYLPLQMLVSAFSAPRVSGRAEITERLSSFKSITCLWFSNTCHFGNTFNVFMLCYKWT